MPDLTGCSTVMLQPQADTRLNSVAPTMSAGSATPLYLLRGVVGLFRYDVSAIPSNATLAAAELRVVYPALACGAGCGSCSVGDSSCPVRLYAMSSDWDEASATWKSRRTGVDWPNPGGIGSDRSSLLVEILHAAEQDSVFPIPPEQLATLWSWRMGNLLTVRLEPDGLFVVASRETAPVCTYQAPSLVLTYCP
jgi:hypothetical protein